MLVSGKLVSQGSMCQSCFSDQCGTFLGPPEDPIYFSKEVSNLHVFINTHIVCVPTKQDHKT